MITNPAVRIGPYPVPISDPRSEMLLGNVWIKPCHGWRVREEVIGPCVGTVGRHPVGLLAMISASVELDDKLWLHVSISRNDRLPSYEDLVLAKNGLIGPERRAIQLFVPAAEHVNDHHFCLHLWSPLEHDPFPDFTRGNGTI